MFILLLIITSRLTENNDEEEGFNCHHNFQPWQRTGRYRSQQVATGIGRRQGQKGQTMKLHFIVWARGIYLFFLNLDMFVCTYTSHVSLSFYWSYHFYQLFHRHLTQLFRVSVYHPLSTVPTHPFTHSPIHPSMIPRRSHIVDLSHRPNYIINHPCLFPGHQRVHTAHCRPFTNITAHSPILPASPMPKNTRSNTSANRSGHRCRSQVATSYKTRKRGDSNTDELATKRPRASKKDR